jgi:hypothetical protein
MITNPPEFVIKVISNGQITTNIDIEELSCLDEFKISKDSFVAPKIKDVIN